MDAAEKGKLRRREREKISRENLDDSYIRKLFREKFVRDGVRISSQDIRPECIALHRAVVTFKRACWGRYVDIDLQKQLCQLGRTSEPKTDNS